MSKFLRMSMWFFLAGAILIAPVAKAGDQYGYNNGFFVSSADDDFMSKMNALLWFNYQGTMLDGAQANTSGFNMPRARLYFTGHAFGPEWSYNVNFDLAGAAGSGTAVTALEYFVNWMHCEKLNVMFGGFRVPFGREFLTPDHQLVFADLSIATTGSGAVPGREIGAMAWGAVADKTVEYWLSVTNGASNGTAFPNGLGVAAQGAGDVDLRYALRLTWNVMGNAGWNLSDLARSEEAAFAVSLGGYWNKAQTVALGSFENTFGLNADAFWKQGGFTGLLEYIMYKAEASAADFTDHNFLGQLAYLFSDTAEVGARLAWLKPDAGGQTIKPGVVLNWLLHGQNAKLQFQYDVALREDVVIGAAPADDLTDHTGTVQLQFAI